MTINLAAWLADYERIGNLAPLFPVSVEKTSQRVASVPELHAALASLGNVTGWLQEVGSVVELRETPVKPVGPLLAGELCSGNTHWLLAYQQQEWMLTRYVITACTPETATHLGEQTRQVRAAATPRSALRGWRYWAPEAVPGSVNNGAPALQFAVFSGFED
jgi:hypothetical protein